MQKKTRKILFFFFFLAFCLISPSLILYSQGYRFDFERKKIVPTGGLFIKAWPKQVNVYLNEKFIKKTDLLFGSALIENLLPRKYKVRMEKDGYYPWEKSLEIKEKEVTTASEIILIPRQLNFNSLFGGVEKFWFSPDLKKIVLKEKEGKEWVLKLYDLEKNIKSHLINEREISQERVSLVNLIFSEDSKEIFLETKIKEEKKVFLLRINKSPLSPIIKNLENMPQNALILKEFKNDQYILDNQGNIFKNGIKINETPLTIKEGVKYDLIIFPDLILLKENESLFYLSLSLKSLQPISELVKGFQPSPDLKKLAYFSEHEVWVFFLKEESGPPKKTAGEKIFIARFSEKINSLSWLGNHHLIFNTGKKIKIAEIDNRDQINIVDLAEFENPEIFFNQREKRIYILSNNNVYQSDVLLKSF